MKVRINYDDIPDEMKQLDQWCCFDIEDDRKIPYTPGTDKKARSNKKSTLRSFEEALEDVLDGTREHIGFCICEDDPYVFFDLDEPQDDEQKANLKEILDVFPSFTELSVSGTGMHIIAKGKLDGRGLHNEYFGLFDKCRFILMTGHVMRKRYKIRRANTVKLEQLQDDVRTSSGKGYNFPLEEIEWDMPHWSLYNICQQVYKQKFIDLMGGEWRSFGYPSQSEADHALISILCEFTQSNELVRFMFAESGLYRDWKGGGEPVLYIDRTIQIQRDKVLNEQFRREEANRIAKEAIAAEQEREARIREQMANPKKRRKKKKKLVTVEDDDAIFDYDEIDEVTYPTDLIDQIPSEMHREIALWLYRGSHLPSQQVSIAGANVIMTFFTQRAYLVNRSLGLNLNWWLVGVSGQGKETFISCVDKVIGELHESRPSIKNRLTGKFASGQAIETAIAETPSVVSKVPEAGAFWKDLCCETKPSHIEVLYQNLLDLFMATDKGKFYTTRRLAKKDDNLPAVFRPAVSLFGETTGTHLFSGGFNIGGAGTGMLQRQTFIMVERGNFTPTNHLKLTSMPPELKDKLLELSRITDDFDHREETIPVRMTKGAHAAYRQLEENLRRKHHDKIIASGQEEDDYFNRTVLKALRFAAQLAVGDSYERPVITKQQMEFAFNYMYKCDQEILSKFATMSSGQARQEKEMLAVIKKLVKADAERRKALSFPEAIWDEPQLVTYSKVKAEAKRKAVFQQDKLGVSDAIDKCINNLSKEGLITRVSRHEATEEYGTSAALLRYNAGG